MKLPGIKRLEVQSLGRRDPNIAKRGAAVTRNIRKQNANIGAAGSAAAAEYTRKARQEDLRGTQANFDTLKQEHATAQNYYRANYRTTQDQYRGEMDKARAERISGQAWETGAYGLARGLGAVARFSQENQEIQARRQIQEADTAMQQMDKSFQEQYLGKDFLGPDELRGTADTPSNRLRQQIPTAEVLPAMMEDHLKNNIEATAKFIDNPHFREMWVEDAKQNAAARVGKAHVLANEHYQRQVVEQQSQELSQFMETGQHDVGMAYIDGMAISETNKEKARELVRNDQEKTTYFNMVAEGDLAGITGAIRHLGQDYDDYKASGGHLDQKERLAFMSDLKGAHAGLTESTRSKNVARERMIVQDFNTMKGRLEDGKTPTAEQFLQMEEQLMSVINPETNAGQERLRELQIYKQASDLITEVNKHGPTDRERLLGQLDDAASAEGQTDYGFTKVADIVRSAHKNQVAAANSDMMKMAIDSGHNIDPIAFDDVESIKSSLEQRMVDHAAMNETYKVSQGPLTKSEAAKFSTIVNTASREQKLGLYSSVFQSVGEEGAQQIFDQLNVEGGASSAAMAGEMVAMDNGDVRGAELVVKGSEYREINSKEFNDLNRSNYMETQINGLTNGMFQKSASRHAATREAIYDAYVGLTLESGNVDFTTVDENTLEAATKLVVGETLTQSGHQIPSFTKTMDQKGFYNYLDTMDSNYINELGGIDDGEGGKLDPEVIKNGMLTGRIEMTWMGHGSYVLKRGGIPLLNRETKKAFVFEYKSDVDKVDGIGATDSEWINNYTSWLHAD